MTNSIARSIFLGPNRYYLAKQYAEAHESETINGNFRQRRSATMDVHNNEHGYRYAVANLPSPTPTNDPRHRTRPDRYLCEILRNRNRLAQRVYWKPRNTSIPTRTFSTAIPIYMSTVNPEGGQPGEPRPRVRLKAKSEFSNQQPCVHP